MKNRAFHESIKGSPYKVMFAMPAKFGLKMSSLLSDSIEHFRTEEELQALIKSVNNASENINSKIENVSNMDNNDLSQNDPSSEVNFKTQKENEAVVTLIQTDIL